MLLVSACSFALDGPPATRPRHGQIDCSTDYWLPVLDGVMTTPGLLAVGALIHDRNKPSNGNDMRSGILGITLVVSSVYALSTIVGVNKVHACREARAEQEKRLAIPAAEDEIAARWELVQVALTAAARGDCAEVRQLRQRLGSVDEVVVEAFDEEPALVACLQPRTPTSCFVATGATSNATICLATVDVCRAAQKELPRGVRVSRCTATTAGGPGT